MTMTIQLTADVIGALAAIGAVGIAIFAFRVAAQTFRRDHRPIIRVVALFQPAILGQPRLPTLDSAVLKNIGRGPAINVIACTTDATLLGDVEALEPLGSADNEADRPGRVAMTFAMQLQIDTTYELYCQDLLSHWHLTRFRPRHYGIECCFVGPVPSRKVPGSVRYWGTVAKL
jgi:hypothetical protein